jgi:hypothetical protein
VSLTSRPHTNGIVEAAVAVAVARHGTALGGWGRTAPDDRTSHSESEVTEGEGEREREEGGELERSTRGEQAGRLGAPSSSYKPTAPAFQAPIFSPGSRNSVPLLGKSTSELFIYDLLLPVSVTLD